MLIPYISTAALCFMNVFTHNYVFNFTRSLRSLNIILYLSIVNTVLNKLCDTILLIIYFIIIRTVANTLYSPLKMVF